MDKKSISTPDINERSEDFFSYLSTQINTETWEFIRRVSKFSDVLIFSGVIRNFFLNHKGKIRDLDLVFNCQEKYLTSLLKGMQYRKNSFGGYKIVIDDLNIDFWHIDNTWAFQKAKVNSLLFKDQNLVDTTFFNFSSIVYSLNRKEFIFNSNFLSFLDEKRLDFVLEDNPLPQLCIVNTIYYKVQFNLEISERLKKYFVDNFSKYDESDYDCVQHKHFQQNIYSYEYLKTYYRIFKKDLKLKEH